MSLNESMNASDIISGICTELSAPSIEKCKRGGSLRYEPSMEEAKKFLMYYEAKETVEAMKLHAEVKNKNYQKLKKTLMQYSKDPRMVVMKPKKAEAKHGKG